MGNSKAKTIVEGLKCCTKQGANGCSRCPYAPDSCSQLMKDALSLISAMQKRLTDLEKGVTV